MGEAEGPAGRPAETRRFALLMRGLKERSGQSYGSLARQLHVSTSTLHRYCNGEAVPTEFATVDRFVRACGADHDEAVELHRAWLLADARRRAAERSGTPSASRPAGSASGSATGAGRTDVSPGRTDVPSGRTDVSSARADGAGGGAGTGTGGAGTKQGAGSGATDPVPRAAAAARGVPAGATGQPGAERPGYAPSRMPWYRRRAVLG
ncbi:helix-turn-helix domain-containing protein, partial [Streptomyces bambusae]|uniref:helix-turn-helix domain-containing protein n=1 Tax=Streptomyces bambusae TaxID=1550616 RepID=UPI0027E072F6